mmetsp:Transcript_5775/g.18176  ORF Transcript_5775/g.18176 Transcript_5775/m.18176 type:complete len:283 (-) Transcript_5775:13-861(-)
MPWHRESQRNSLSSSIGGDGHPVRYPGVPMRCPMNCGEMTVSRGPPSSTRWASPCVRHPLPARSCPQIRPATGPWQWWPPHRCTWRRRRRRLARRRGCESRWRGQASPPCGSLPRRRARRCARSPCSVGRRLCAPCRRRAGTPSTAGAASRWSPRVPSPSRSAKGGRERRSRQACRTRPVRGGGAPHGWPPAAGLRRPRRRGNESTSSARGRRWRSAARTGQSARKPAVARRIASGNARQGRGCSRPRRRRLRRARKQGAPGRRGESSCVRGRSQRRQQTNQ